MSDVKSANMNLDILLSRIMLAATGTPREAYPPGSELVLADVVNQYLAVHQLPRSGALAQDVAAALEAYEAAARARTVDAAQQLLELEGKRVLFRDVRVREEVAASCHGEKLPHPGDRRGVLLHPALLEALVGLAEVQCYELGWLRSTHGKYKSTAGDTSQIDMDAELSAHFYGMGADFYAAGSSLDRLVRHDAGQVALDDALRPLVQAMWNGVVSLPVGWWVVMPPSLNPETPGTRAGVQFFSVFFGVRKPFPLVAALLGGVAGAVSGVIGCLLARRVSRLGLLTS